MNDILTYFSQLTGLQPATLVLLGGILITISNALSRIIPDDATGFLAFIRVVTKYVGVNVSSRVTSGVSINDVARTLLQTNQAKPEVADQLKASGVMAAPGIAGITRQTNGKFAKVQSPWFVTVLVFVLVIMGFGLGGCSTLSDANIGKTLCQNQIVSRAALNLKIAEDSKIKDEAIRAAALSLDDSAMAVLNACPPLNIGPAPATN